MDDGVSAEANFADHARCGLQSCEHGGALLCIMYLEIERFQPA